MLEKQKKRYRRHRRIRIKVLGTRERPRLCVFRSLKHIHTQLIDDKEGKTLVSASDLSFRKSKVKSQKPSRAKRGKVGDEARPQRSSKVKIAYELGKLIAKKAKDLKIEKVVFDRGGYKYHGRVKALAEGAREGGLKF